MKNKKGFVMTETLVVTVFLVTIFTFIYVSIVPLLGIYDDMANRDSDIDIVYKLYHIRNMLMKDENRFDITKDAFNSEITCNDVSTANKDYCNKLMEYLDLNNYRLVYANNIQNNMSNFASVSEVMYDYISKYKDVEGDVLVLIDNNKYTVAHLSYFG